MLDSTIRKYCSVSTALKFMPFGVFGRGMAFVIRPPPPSGGYFLELGTLFRFFFISVPFPASQLTSLNLRRKELLGAHGIGHSHLLAFYRGVTVDAAAALLRPDAEMHVHRPLLSRFRVVEVRWSDFTKHIGFDEQATRTDGVHLHQCI